MKELAIHPPQYIHELGSRSNNEDVIFPKQPSQEDRLFMVCDGVGGQDKGEVAAQLSCTVFHTYFQNNSAATVDKSFLESGLRFVEEHLKNYIQLHPNARTMASTLTLLYFSSTKKKLHLAWVGDSRIYHIRNGDILYRTKDHSHIQSLLDMGEVTAEEVKQHPKRNVILRAINGTSPTRLDYTSISNIVSNDFFMLCSDGILETLTITQIQQWFRSGNDAMNIKTNILENAKGHTRDNFSMILLKIK